ncbi:MAG: GNAT family N-acetyltransferase [Bacteroidota bacterium]
MQLSYRPYQAADFSYCNALMEKNMGAYFTQLGIKWDPERYAKELTKSLVWIIWLGEAKVGFVHCSEKEGSPYINSIQIAAAYRQQGIGSQVLSWLETTYKQQNQLSIGLSVFKTSPALSLYQRLGYSICADRGNKYLMQKSL